MFLSQKRLSEEGATRQAGFCNLDVCVVDSIYIKSYHPAFPKALLDLCTCASLDPPVVAAHTWTITQPSLSPTDLSPLSLSVVTSQFKAIPGVGIALIGSRRSTVLP
jgi:hypothetical protein